MKHRVIDPCPPKENAVIELGGQVFSQLCREITNFHRNGPFVAYQSSTGARNVCILCVGAYRKNFGFRCLVDVLKDSNYANASALCPPNSKLTYQGSNVHNAIKNAMKYREVFIFDDPASLYCWIGEVGRSLTKDYE